MMKIKDRERRCEPTMRRVARGMIAAAFVLSPVWAGAQPVELGVKGAVAFATLPRIQDALVVSGSNYEPRYRTGLLVGGFGAVRLAEWLAVQPELLVVQKGVSLEGPSVNPIWFKAYSTYLEIPVLARLAAAAGAHERHLYVVAGPSAGIRLNARVERGTLSSRQPVDADTWLRRGDLGFVAGTGVQFSRWLVEWRVSQGLLRVNQRVPDLRRDVRNRAVALLTGITF